MACSAKWPAGLVLPSLAAFSAAALLSGCGASDDIMSSVALQPAETVPSDGARNAAAAPPGMGHGQPNDLVVTPQQRAFLDALSAGGIAPSSELLALSIGSYVCQARAAGQSDQAVWDFVLPLVRSDVNHVDVRSMEPSAPQVDDATADYIQIATDRLC